MTCFHIGLAVICILALGVASLEYATDNERLLEEGNEDRYNALLMGSTLCELAEGALSIYAISLIFKSLKIVKRIAGKTDN